jgi:LPXTG-motif cell wall-anchored protein
MKAGILLLALSMLNYSSAAGPPAGKTNYAFPIIAGAILGIALALWLKRKK